MLTDLQRNDGDVWVFRGLKTANAVVAKAPVQNGRAKIGRLEFTPAHFVDRARTTKISLPLHMCFVPKRHVAANDETALRRMLWMTLYVSPPPFWVTCRPLLNGLFHGCWIEARFMFEGSSAADWYQGHLDTYNEADGARPPPALLQHE